MEMKMIIMIMIKSQEVVSRHEECDLSQGLLI